MPGLAWPGLAWLVLAHPSYLAAFLMYIFEFFNPLGSSTPRMTSRCITSHHRALSFSLSLPPFFVCLCYSLSDRTSAPHYRHYIPWLIHAFCILDNILYTISHKLYTLYSKICTLHYALYNLHYVLCT